MGVVGVLADNSDEFGGPIFGVWEHLGRKCCADSSAGTFKRVVDQLMQLIFNG